MPDDDFLYAQVAQEITDGRIDKTTWTRAFAHSGGAEDATKSLYIRFRVESLREQVQQAAIVANQQKRLAMQQAKEQVQAGGQVSCPNCGHRGDPIKEARGGASQLGICFLLLIVFFPLGIIYACFTSGYRYKCAKCGTQFHRDTIK